MRLRYLLVLHKFDTDAGEQFNAFAPDFGAFWGCGSSAEEALSAVADGIVENLLTFGKAPPPAVYTPQRSEAEKEEDGGDYLLEYYYLELDGGD